MSGRALVHRACRPLDGDLEEPISLSTTCHCEVVQRWSLLATSLGKCGLHGRESSRLHPRLGSPRLTGMDGLISVNRVCDAAGSDDSPFPDCRFVLRSETTITYGVSRLDHGSLHALRTIHERAFFSRLLPLHPSD